MTFFSKLKITFVGFFSGGSQLFNHLEAGEDALTLAPAMS